MIKLIYYFNVTFPTYESYLEYCKEIDLFDTTQPLLNNFNKWCYNALFRAYYNVPANYSNIESFLNEFSNVMLDTFNRYQKEVELIESIYQLQVEDFAKTRDTLVSRANNNNKNATDPSKFTSYISDQSFSTETLSKFQGYLQAITQIPSYRIQEFVNKFRYLFQSIFSNSCGW